MLKSDRLLLIGGVIGITGLLQFMWCHSNVKLCYSTKTSVQCLVDTLSATLNEVHQKEISVGKKLNIDTILNEEVNLGWLRIAVVVCGSAAMCDDVRTIVAWLGRENTGQCALELSVEAFSW